MKKACFIFLLLLFAPISAWTQKGHQLQKTTLSDEAVVKRYLENGAYRYHYFSPEWQVYLDSAILLKPAMAYLYQQKAMPYFKQRKYQVGLHYLEKAVRLDSITYIDYQAFIKCIFSKDYEAAIHDFEIAKRLKGKNSYVMDHTYDFHIGLCHLQLADYKKALFFFDKSIEHTRKTSGENWIHYLDLFYAGVTCQEMRQHKEALNYFNKALVEYTTFSDAKYYKAISLFRTNQVELAEKTLAECEKDYKNGLTINEDNAIYEKYPYQIKQWNIDVLKIYKR